MIIVQTPLRVSFVGGGTDFDDFSCNNGGAVLSTAINKSVYVIVKERFDDMIYVNYSQKEIVTKIDDLQHELVRETMRMAGVERGIEITTLADIPSDGIGLGSSSAVTVGLLQSLHAYHGHSVTAEQLAKEACKIEIDILQKPMGRQDQYASAFGNMRFITFKNSKVKTEEIELASEDKRRLNDALLLFYTGKTRKATEVLAEQKANISQRIDILYEMKQLVFEGKKAIAECAFDELGEIIHRSWVLKNILYSFSQ